ncbi:MAG: hypothetical protein K0R09_3328, partial [Clostridiales bacterium]|nr:hypothetical protein [Clostridiales bacterium]
MKNKDRVYDYLKKLTEGIRLEEKLGFTAEEMTEFLSLKR